LLFKESKFAFPKSFISFIIGDEFISIRLKDKEIKHMKDRMLLDQQGKTGQQLLTEKKLSDFIENERRLTQEIE
jgi:hypothetical protein